LPVVDYDTDEAEVQGQNYDVLTFHVRETSSALCRSREFGCRCFITKIQTSVGTELMLNTGYFMFMNPEVNVMRKKVVARVSAKSMDTSLRS
jgi:hypothetical protein